MLGSAITIPLSKGITAQVSKLTVNINIGASKKMPLFAALGKIDSLLNNFIASAKACNIPAKPTTLGPLLLCIPANTLRSNKVKKAILSISGSKIGKAVK